MEVDAYLCFRSASVSVLAVLRVSEHRQLQRPGPRQHRGGLLHAAVERPGGSVQVLQPSPS